MDSWRRHTLVFWLFSLPPTLWLVAFFLLPLALVWLLSFGEKQGIVEIAITGTLNNYARALHPLYLWIFAKSLGVAGLTTLICLVLAFPMMIGLKYALAEGTTLFFWVPFTVCFALAKAITWTRSRRMARRV